MGGDGGTLNNSRREHVRLRNRVLGTSSSTNSSTSRASVTDCALSKARLSPPHVVVDRAGNLYNKEALLAYILTRRKRDASMDNIDSDPLAHIRSIKRDTAPVSFLPGESRLMCPVTRKMVFEEGAFSVGWNCGCVTAPVQRDVGIAASDDPYDEKCIACDERGSRVVLGATFAHREEILQEMKKLRKPKQDKKRRMRTELASPKTTPTGQNTTDSKQESPLRKVPRLASSTG